MGAKTKIDWCDASWTEYRPYPDYRNGAYLMCVCPTCHKSVTRADENQLSANA